MVETISLWLILVFSFVIMLIILFDWISDYRSGYFSDKEKEKEMLESARKSQVQRRIKDEVDWRGSFKNDKY
jgi:hypothetical protein